MKQKKRRRVSHSSATDKSSHAKLANETLSTKDDIAVESPAKKVSVVFICNYIFNIELNLRCFGNRCLGLHAEKRHGKQLLWRSINIFCF